MFTLNEILIKSFAYNDKKYVEKKVTDTKYSLRTLSKRSEERTFKELQEVKITHAIIYLIDQNRFWYYKIIDDQIVEKHHTKNNYDNSVKIIDDMIERFKKLDKTKSIIDYYDIKKRSNKEHITIKELTTIETDSYQKNEKLKGMFL